MSTTIYALAHAEERTSVAKLADELELDKVDINDAAINTHLVPVDYLTGDRS